MKIFRDHFFHTVDILLPRPIAAIPYQLALESLTLLIGTTGVEIWSRNSFRRGNYTFGLSDLDLTIFIKNGPDKNQVEEIKSILKEQKKIYPFLGETNFYWEKYADKFSSSFNMFERQRDPLLDSRLSPRVYDTDIEKCVFLFRMLFSDYEKLNRFPYLRQKKWKQHFIDLGLQPQREIHVNHIENALQQTLENFSLVPVFDFLKKSDLSDQSVFFDEKPVEWKYIYPHKHLWFTDENDRDLDLSGLEKVRQICLRQISWEVWGIMSQMPSLFHHKDGIKLHMGRLEKVAKSLNADAELLNQISALVEFTNYF